MSDDNTDNVEKGEGANGSSRFSDDGMETEIEVKKDEPTPQKRKRKHKRKSNDPDAKEAEASRTHGDDKDSVPDTPPPEYQSQNDLSEQAETKKGRKAKMAKGFSNLRSTPVILIEALTICVFVPMAIYACDVILSVNVLQRDDLWKSVINEETDFKMLPRPIDVTGHKYNISNTLLITIQINSAHELEARHKRQAIDDSVINANNETDLGTTGKIEAIEAVPPTILTTETADVTTPQPASKNFTEAIVSVTTTTATQLGTEATTLIASSNQTTRPTGDESFTRKVNETSSPTTVKLPTSTTTEMVETTPPFESTEETTYWDATTYPGVVGKDWKQQEGEYCKGLYYFYETHISTAFVDKVDWFDTEVESLRKKQQALFFLFTVFGFIFLLASIATRSEIYLNDQWSSYIIFPFVLYSISMALTASVFSQENGSGGLRCCVCRFSTNCTDIDPWDWSTHWPKTPDNDTWSLVALLSFILKALDCLLIGYKTLKFILNVSEDSWWKTFLKFLGWVVFFPILIFAPMLGVVRYQVFPAVIPEDNVAFVTVEVFFYIGVALWAFIVIGLPIFCKLRMCNKSQAEVEEDIEDEYYN